MKNNNYHYWIKLQRRYRNVKAKWVENQDAIAARKLDIIGRRLHAHNRKWKLGIATAALSAWLAVMPSTELHAQTFPATFDLSTLDGSNGFVLNGVGINDAVINSVSGAGDVNGDGVDDLVIGAHYTNPNGNSDAGETYVVFGQTGGFPAGLNISELNGSNGFVLNGIDAFDNSGFSVNGAGDVNGDGLDDLLIGARGGNSSAGETYVVFGQTSAFSASMNLSDLNGSNGFVLNGVVAGDLSGSSVSGAGDVNGDGVDDLLIGAHRADPYDAGETYVVFGQTSAFPASMNLSDLDGNNGFVLKGIDFGDFSGLSVSGVGDVNGDEVDDLLIAAERADPNSNSDAGETYVVFGQTGAFPASMNLSALNGSNGFVLNGMDINDNSGHSVSGAGDVNGDGVDDLLIGAYLADPNGINSGETYVVFGKTSAFTSSMDLSNLDGNNGFVLKGIDADDFSGRSVSGAGDVNGDGVDDLLIGAERADPNGNGNSGETYVIFGKTSAFPSSIELSGLDGSNGFVLNGIRNNNGSGRTVSSAGDVNGDGVDDLLIGAYFESAGVTYVVFGIAPQTAPTVVNAILDQQTNEDQIFDFIVPINTFDDINAGDVLVLTATLAGGGALPSWLTFTPSTETFNGIATNDNVGTISIEVTATDPGGLFVSDLFDLEVVNVDHAPVLADIGAQSGDEGTEIMFTASATDVDIPANTLTFSLDAASLGLGMTIDGSTGTFTWTPIEAQSGNHDVTVTVSDGILTDDEIVTITVNGVNIAPILAAIGVQSGDEETVIAFAVSATDADLPANTLIFNLDATSAGKGVTIDGSTGAFTWTPTEAQSGNHDVTVTVSDGTLTDDEIVTIIVNEVNIAPVMAAIGGQSGDEGTEITFTASAADVDLPANMLTFGLDAASTEKGMTIDGSTGAFSWIPTGAQSGTHDVTVTVSDGTLTDSKLVTITVVGLALGTNELSTIRMYPNPVKEQLEIVGLTEARTATFYSLIGARALDIEVKGNFIDVRALKNGVFVVEIKDEQGLVIFQSRLLKTN